MSSIPNPATSCRPDLNTQNLIDGTLKYWRAAFGRVRANTGNANAIFLGDSVPAGSTGLSTAAQTYAARTSALLASRLGLTSRQVFVPTSYPAGVGGTDPQLTIGTGWSAQSYGPGTLGNQQGTVAGAGTIDYAPTFQVDGFKIFCLKGGSSGDIQYAIDGGAYSTLTNPGGASFDANSFSVSAGALGTHTLHLKAAASGNAPWVWGVIGTNSTQFGIGVVPIGAAGLWMADWAGAAGAASAGTYWPGAGAGVTPHGLNVLAPDLVGVFLGINDCNNQAALATFQTNAATVITNIRAALTKPADVVMIVPHNINTTPTIPFSSYQNIIVSTAIANNCAIFRPDLRWGAWSAVNATPQSYMADAYHPNVAGHLDLGGMISSLMATLV